MTTTHWTHVDTHDDKATGLRTVRTVCGRGDWASDWGTPVEAFEAGADTTTFAVPYILNDQPVPDTSG